MKQAELLPYVFYPPFFDYLELPSSEMLFHQTPCKSLLSEKKMSSKVISGGSVAQCLARQTHYPAVVGLIPDRAVLELP